MAIISRFDLALGARSPEVQERPPAPLSLRRGAIIPVLGMNLSSKIRVIYGDIGLRRPGEWFTLRVPCSCRVWRGGRAVEGARLESVYTLTRIEGSNPSLSANYLAKHPLSGVWQNSR